MGRSLDPSLRHKIVEGKKQGRTYTSLANEFGVGYNSVRTICHRYEKEGSLGLLPKTSNCGRRVQSVSYFAYRFVRLIAHLHPTWGILYILTRISHNYPELILQSTRHYQRLIKRHFGTPPPPVLPQSGTFDRARVAHQTWQVDAKEHLHFIDTPDQEGCFLNITDEKTTALLNAKAFPPRADYSSLYCPNSCIFDRNVSKMGSSSGY
jgi:hypothetical protein